ncbi:DUF1349 domain-containing protein [Streptomyces umbrinus]|uniref:DUF1349 domain-containing protein n=1 Tax=Streptomyces umbrinus TaxID=67370 RepID=UPI00216B6300|nr:DUF1349 domain-containing protein [Streptomyces umbrinus]
MVKAAAAAPATSSSPREQVPDSTLSPCSTPRPFGVPDGDFQFSAHVTVDLDSRFDASVLLLWVDGRHWGKLRFEYSPRLRTHGRSVVARRFADDAKAFVVDSRTVWPRIFRIDQAFAHHGRPR